GDELLLSADRRRASVCAAMQARHQIAVLRLFQALLLLLLALGMAGCQGVAANNSAPPSNGNGATPGLLTSAPASLAFGNVPVGRGKQQSATLTNSGASSLTISKAAVSGSGFTLSGLSVPLDLAVGKSTTLTVTFAPQASGSAS